MTFLAVFGGGEVVGLDRLGIRNNGTDIFGGAVMVRQWDFSYEGKSRELLNI